HTEGDGGYYADQVAVCVGTGTPSDHYGLETDPGFVRDPYPLAHTLETVESDSDVAIIGSGLTAVDIVVSLAARGHTGRITLVSRSGVLPHVWQRPSGYRPRHLTAAGVAALEKDRGAVRLDGIIELLRADLSEAGEDYDGFAAELLATETEKPVERLRSQLAAVGDGRIGRGLLQEAAHAVAPFAWRLLSETDRSRLRRWFRVANSVVSPMVPVNAAAMLWLFDSGQLGQATGVRAIDVEDGRFRVRSADGDCAADVVINAVNPPPHAIPAAAGQLVASLLAGGTAKPHASGGLIPADPRLHVVGDLAGGGSFITAGIPAIAAQAARAGAAMFAEPAAARLV
ncbi:MAG: FAD/NAD(P)-binding protein, partial [Stackebrandtia sp.]